MNGTALTFLIFISFIIFSASQEGETNGETNLTSIKRKYPPRFSIYTSSGKLLPGGRIDITENSVPGKFLALLEIENSDRRVMCSIDSDLITLQPVSLTEYKIITNGHFDREEMDTFQFKVICRGDDNPSIPSSVLINVNILDINDNAPTFQKESYEFEVFENNEPVMTISTLHAVDRDVSENGRITYDLESEEKEMFAINSSTGDLKTKVVFDREMQDKYEFHVLAKDNGLPKRTGTTIVQVKIKDVNDNVPVFGKDDFELNISGNIKNGTVVARLIAYDIDINKDPLKYSLTEYYKKFSIPFNVLSTGAIIATQDINLDHVMIFMFGVSVTDTGAPVSLSSSAIVHITYRPE